jgi:hypothetical protein
MSSTDRRLSRAPEGTSIKDNERYTSFKSNGLVHACMIPGVWHCDLSEDPEILYWPLCEPFKTTNRVWHTLEVKKKQQGNPTHWGQSFPVLGPEHCLGAEVTCLHCLLFL